ncbi:hypothetical protein ACOSQ4_005080 [Xanthoceras sorbifolium]
MSSCIKKEKKMGKKGFFGLKLDMLKVYDRVDCDFIEGMMKTLGFTLRWITLIILCVHSISYSFLLNGVSSCILKPSRGLRHGDPLSHYLFLLCAEGFSSLIFQAERDGLYHGFCCSRNSPNIFHLFFADDSLLLTCASLKDCVALKNILHLYFLATEQQVNFSKSTVSFSRAVPSVRG